MTTNARRHTRGKIRAFCVAHGQKEEKAYIWKFEHLEEVEQYQKQYYQEHKVVNFAQTKQQ